MRTPKYEVKLSGAERAMLDDILKKGVHASRKIRRVNILLSLDDLNHCYPNPKYKPNHEDIATRWGVSPSTVYSISKKFAEEGLEAALTRKERETPPITPIVTGDIEARIIALACGEPPEGYSRWTLRLLETKVVELGIMEQVSDTTIYRVLKKRNCART